MKKIRYSRRHIFCRYQQCLRCGYKGNFPDSGECPGCGEVN